MTTLRDGAPSHQPFYQNDEQLLLVLRCSTSGASTCQVLAARVRVVGNALQVPLTRGMEMPVPNYQAFMLPLLKLASDGNDHRLSEAIDALADQLMSTGSSAQRRPISSNGSRGIARDQARLRRKR